CMASTCSLVFLRETFFHFGIHSPATFSMWIPLSPSLFLRLQCAHARFPSGQAGSCASRQASRVRSRDHRPAHHRRHPAGHHAGPLLVRYPLESSLNPEPLLVAILGPTASGKTALSLALAQRFQGEIVNCDSVAMVRELEMGTAKPTAEERA